MVFDCGFALCGLIGFAVFTMEEAVINIFLTILPPESYNLQNK